MCNNVSLPPVGYANQLMHNLELVNNPNADVPEDADAETAARNSLPVGGDFIRREEEGLGEIAREMNVCRFSGVLIDRGRTNRTLFEYDEIFSIWKRRADRCSQQSTEPHQELIKQWLENIRSRNLDEALWFEDAVDELGDREFIPKNNQCFQRMVHRSLPAKLDWNSWIGKLAKQKLLEDNAEAFSTGELIVRRDRLVWRENKSGDVSSIRPDIGALLIEADQSLVRLSVQIANWLAWVVFKDHILPMARMRRRNVLTSGDIIDAVVEILGHDWFKLPFDDDDQLKSWKWSRTFLWNVDEYMAVVDGYDPR